MSLKELMHELKAMGSQMRVLYVEDDENIRIQVNSLLGELFGSITLAENGQIGLEHYAEGEFDIVISDILMPVLDGIAMIREIKERNPMQSVIVTSAFDESDYLRQLIDLGVSKFILKPLLSEQMIRSLHEVANNVYNAQKVKEYTANLQHELSHHKQLLEQYKEIVDITTIVSKTDTKGMIIYANDAFCEVSGYAIDELIGQPHNIVRHPEVPSEVFKELWQTIQSKKIWKGVLKNRKKNGEYYITDTTIKPIFDLNGEIAEFISVRHEITELFDLNEEIRATQHELLYVLGEIGETRSQETGNHVRRVAEYSRLLATLCELPQEDIDLLYAASPMHDIGKIGIPDQILLKPGKLTAEEFETIKAHTTIGYQIFKNSHRPILEAAKVIAHEHHERWDGTGYPRGLAGDGIHIYGRITALVDVFDALSCDRVYKEAWPMEKILRLIEEEKGKHFDPRLVALFFENLESFMEIHRRYRNHGVESCGH